MHAGHRATASEYECELKRSAICAYCGKRPATDLEHVFPRNLYPASKAHSRVQRLTIPSCNICNNGFADDEAHFRNILSVAGEPNESRKELWETSISRSFEEPDALRRIRDLLQLFQTATVDGRPRYKVYPGQDQRVIRVVKKVVRGLSHYHRIMSAVPESLVWVDVMKYRVPEQFLNEMIYHHREPDIAEYRYAVSADQDIQSFWLITFFERVIFIGAVGWSPTSL